MIEVKRRHIYMLTRKEKRISHAEIAAKIGISQSAISQYETGKINLKLDTQRAYEQYIESK